MSGRNPAVRLYDAEGHPLDVQDGVAIPANTPGLLLAGKDGSGYARFTRVATDGTLRIDPTGSTTQPISAAALPLPAGAATEATLLLKADAAQFPAALVGGRLDANIGAWFGSTAPTAGRKTMAASVPVVLPSDQPPIPIQFGQPGGLTALPKIIDITFNKSEGALVANAYKRVATYTVPIGYIGYLIKFVSFQNEVASSRVVAETNLGTHNNNTNIFTAGTPYVDPQWASVIQAEVTTAFAAGSGNVVLTVGYTNENGTAGRTGTITIPKGSVIGSRWDLVLQAGDLGLRSIQTVSGTPTQVGVVKILGLVQLGLHQDQSTTAQTETLYAPGAITFPAGTVIGIEYAGGTVSKQRILNALIQLLVQ